MKGLRLGIEDVHRMKHRNPCHPPGAGDRFLRPGQVVDPHRRFAGLDIDDGEKAYSDENNDPHGYPQTVRFPAAGAL